MKKEYLIYKLSEEMKEATRIDNELFPKFDVKRGLRNEDGTGVLVGLTKIGNVVGYERVPGGGLKPIPGKLFYRGYDVEDISHAIIKEKRFGFEEAAYLLMFGCLPDRRELKQFCDVLGSMRTLPTNFVRDVIMKAPSRDIMNSLMKSILTLASYDSRVNDLSEVNVLRQCMMLISEVPMMAVYGYHAYNHYECEESMYIHRPSPELSTAENILMMLRPDKKYTELEARVLDVALMLHMEHGGGNNSTFTTHVVTSSGSDTYSVMAAALASLKGPKHGGANIKVMEMMDDLRANVSDTKDEEKIRNYLDQLVDKQAFDKKGLIYGMGHAVYSLSDPRAVVFKSFVESLAKEKGRMDDYHLYTTIERLAPEVIAEKRKIYKGVSANVDFYSGFVYSMLGIPVELYTPIFAMARVVGWSAHRMEELVNADKIIRPAYKSVAEKRIYQPIDKRQERELAGGNYRKIEEK